MPKGSARRWPRGSEPPPIKILFRYRDLVQPTLQRHREVLKREGAVWWGWWKRPAEDARRDVWSSIGSELKKTKCIRVGLFDSGSGEVHGAWVKRILPPLEGESTTLEPVRLAKRELRLVPAYYRNSPFSRAWMQIVDIEEKPINFFGQHSFEEMPPHLIKSFPEISQLKDKIIFDASELRGIDTTIWMVRPRRRHDGTERLILSTRLNVIGEAISETPLRTNGDVILHITDPHFAIGLNRNQHVWRLESESSSRDSLAEAVSRAIDRQNVAFVVVTGDLTFVGSPDEFREARTFLTRLRGQLNLGPEHFIIVPGNHDIKWSRPGSDTYNPNEEVCSAPDEATRNYRTFYRDFFGHDPDYKLAMARKYVLQQGGVIEVCGVNSSSLAVGRNYLAGMGRVDGGSFDEIARRFGWKSNSRSLAFRLLALHHHLVPTEDLEDAKGYYSGFGMASDATRIQRMAARNGVHLAIHGHKHREFLWRSDVYELPEDAHETWTLGPLSLLGGGSAGSKETDSAKNYFNTIKINAKNITVEIFRSKSAQHFETMTTWTSSFSLSSGRLQLGAWQSEGKK
jgi:3',5'-cyclic AMP phosphodiesterase CpdA